VADAAGTIIQPLAESRGIAFVDRAVGAPRVQFVGDEDRVRQILVNLLTNAVKFTDAGGRVTLERGASDRPDPDARLRGPGPWTYFRVSDTGKGIPHDQLSRIFEPFVQVESGHTRSRDGSGLGLTISRRLARLMRGDITVRSEPGEGSTFTVWLPAAHESRPDAAEAGPREDRTRLRGLADIGEMLLRELEPMIETFVTRIREECPTPGAATLRFYQLADHAPSFLADLAGMLIALDESEGQASSILTDAADIQRLVAGRHGAQRARLGWDEAAIRCEYEILRGEIERVVRQRARAVEPGAIEESLEVMRRFLEEAERTSLRALARVRGTDGAAEAAQPGSDG
jgi:hypothetical protein